MKKNKKSKELERVIKETIILNRNNGFWFSNICMLLERKYNVNVHWFYANNLTNKFYPIKENGITIVLWDDIKTIDDITIVYGTCDIRQ